MSKVVNLTPAILRRIINEEKKKLAKKLQSADPTLEKEAKKTRVVGPDEMADTLAKKVEHYKELQAEAAALAKRLSKINESRQQLRGEILEGIE